MINDSTRLEATRKAIKEQMLAFRRLMNKSDKKAFSNVGDGYMSE